MLSLGNSNLKLVHPTVDSAQGYRNKQERPHI